MDYSCMVKSCGSIEHAFRILVELQKAVTLKASGAYEGHVHSDVHRF